MNSQEIFKERIILNEETVDGMTYIGKTPNILKVEECIRKLINPKYHNNAMSTKELLNSPLRQKICRLLEKEFGFAMIELTFHNTIDNPVHFYQTASELYNPTPIPPEKEGDSVTFPPFKKRLDDVLKTQVSGYTVPYKGIIKEFITDEPSILNHKNKFYDYSHRHICFISLKTAYFDGTLTAEEVTYILLHEIGHNFDISISTYFADVMGSILFSYNSIKDATVLLKQQNQAPPPLINMILNTVVYNYTTKLISPLCVYAKSVFYQFMYQHTLVSYIMELARRVMHTYCELMHLLWPLRLKKVWKEKFVNVIKLMELVKTDYTPFGLLDAIWNAVGQSFMFNSERFADSFATMYGYGPAGITLMEKWEDNAYLDIEGIGKKNTPLFMREYIQIGSLLKTIPCFLLDEHPEDQTRMKMMLEDTKMLAQNKQFSPRARKAIQRDYENAKEAYDHYLRMDKKDRKVISARLSRLFKETYFAGKMDFRSYLFTCTAIQSGVINETRKGKKSNA